MAIFINGMKCPLCGEPMFADQSVRMFKPFVSNPDDPLVVFNDATVHETCFLNDKRAVAAERRYKAFLDANAPASRVCRASGKLITDPDDYFALGFLTDDPSEPLHEFNWAHFSKDALGRWRERESLLALLDTARSNPKMHRAGIEWLIAEIQRTSGSPS